MHAGQREAVCFESPVVIHLTCTQLFECTEKYNFSFVSSRALDLYPFHKNLSFKCYSDLFFPFLLYFFLLFNCHVLMD